METTAEQINSKIELTGAAVALYSERGSFTISQLIDATGYTASQIYALFPNKRSILEYYYPSLVIRYEAMIGEIEGFEHYTISEKLSSIIFTSFDMMSEKRSFVENTFHSMVFSKGKNSEFHEEVTTLFKHFFTSDAEVAVSAAFLMKDYFYEFIAKEYLHIVKFWLKDDSEGKDRSIALVDKLTGFLQELIYNKTIDKGFDLAKYLITYAGLAKNIPIVGEWITDWFKGEQKDE